MTLVSVWLAPNKLTCATDSRISGDTSTLTDVGGKLFVVPVKCKYLESGKWIDGVSYTLGFAFAGSTLLANNTQALASTLTQIFTSKDFDIPSALTVARLYAKCAEHAISDMNWRSSDHKFFESIIFGYCPIEREFICYKIEPNLSDSSFSMVVRKLHGNGLFVTAFGTGAKDFLDIIRRETTPDGCCPDPLAVFRYIVENEVNSSVGGNIQLAEATEDGVSILPVLKAEESILLTLNGLEITEEFDGFGFCVVALAIGFEKLEMEAALRAKGIDPDDHSITQETKNLAAFEHGLMVSKNCGSDFEISLNYELEPVKPLMTESYLCTTCKICNKDAPICKCPSDFDISSIKGNGLMKTRCWHCDAVVHGKVGELKKFVWNLPSQ